MSEHYALIKMVHMACAWLSISGFLLRGFLRWRHSTWVERRITRVLPHCIDTLLLLSALLMASISGQWPLQQDWLSAKLFALLVYIGLGMIAFRFGRNRAERGVAFLAAVTVFLYIVAVATLRTPLPFIS